MISACTHPMTGTLNTDAYDFLYRMANIYRVWDDLWDKDKEVSKEQADDVISDLAFELSRNKFYKENQAALEAFIFVSWNAWSDANIWKGHDNKMKALCAWFVRDYCCEITALVAWLVGGKEHARNLSLTIREFFVIRLIENGVKL